MAVISIGTEDQVEELKKSFHAHRHLLEDKGIGITIQQVERGRMTFLGCKFNAPKNLRKTADKTSRQFVAGIVSDMIVDSWESRLVRRFIRHYYNYFDSGEQQTIYDYACRNLEMATPGSITLKRERKNRILQRLINYLEKHQEVVIDGFLTFRMKDYVRELEDAVDQAVDDFLLEKEYEEFIRLLKYFVDVQNPRIPQVHILLRKSGIFQLVDDEGEMLNNEYLEEFVGEMVRTDIDYDDLLVSSLINLAPQHIIVHNRQWAKGEVVGTVQQVFSGRVHFCDGCSHCLPEA